MVKADQLELFTPNQAPAPVVSEPTLHEVTAGVIADIKAAEHPAELRGVASAIGRTLLEAKVPSADIDSAFKVLKDRKASFRASPQAIAASLPPDSAPDPKPKPLSRIRPVSTHSDDAPRERDFRERQFKD
jgi:hypothetical protein